MTAGASEIVERFERICHDDPGRPLIHLPSAGRTLAAADIRATALQQRQRLERLGAGPGTLVVYAAGNPPDLFGCVLACRSLQAPVLPLDVGTTAPEMATLARRFGASVLIAADVAPRVPGFAVYEPYTAGLMAATAAAHAARGLFGGAAVLKLTSGSTASPRATFTTEA